MTEKEKSFIAGCEYLPSDAELSLERAETVKKLYVYNGLHPLDTAKRREVMLSILGSAKGSFCVEQPFFCTYGSNIYAGENLFINVGCKLLDSGGIRLGDNVFIAPNVCIITEEHVLDSVKRAQGVEFTRPVVIGDNVWIGAAATVLSGATIGDNCVIGAGSVVTKDVPANSVAVGNPCRVIKKTV